MKNIYESYMGWDYDVQAEIVLRYLEDGDVVADIGANNGSQMIDATNVVDNCHFLANEPDLSVISELEARELRSGTFEVFAEGANQFLSREELPEFDLVLCGSTIHEIHKTNKNIGPVEAVKQFLTACISHMEPGGRLIISDRYYHPTASQTNVEATMAQQFKAIGHADERWAFVSSDQLRFAAESLGLKLIESHEHVSRAIALRYFFVHVYEIV